MLKSSQGGPRHPETHLMHAAVTVASLHSCGQVLGFGTLWPYCCSCGHLLCSQWEGHACKDVQSLLRAF